jgi:hypothetical protein
MLRLSDALVNFFCTHVEIFATRTFGDGSAAVRLSDGNSNSRSADSKWVMGLTGFNLHNLLFPPTGTGQAQTINLGTLGYHWGNWLPNDHQILFLGNKPGYGGRIYLIDFPQARPRPVTAEGVGVVNYTYFVSPDGQSFLGLDSERNSVAYSVQSGQGKPVPGLILHKLLSAGRGMARAFMSIARPGLPGYIASN